METFHEIIKKADIAFAGDNFFKKHYKNAKRQATFLEQRKIRRTSTGRRRPGNIKHIDQKKIRK